MASEYLNNKTFEQLISQYQQAKRQSAKCELIGAELRETHERRQAAYRDDAKLQAVLDNEQLHQQARQQFALYQDQLAEAFYLLATNIVNYARFNGLDSDDAVQEGVLICFDKLDRFDPRKGKAFNYMTTCVLNHFRQLYRSVRSYGELKNKYRAHLQRRAPHGTVRQAATYLHESLRTSD